MFKARNLNSLPFFLSGANSAAGIFFLLAVWLRVLLKSCMYFHLSYWEIWLPCKFASVLKALMQLAWPSFIFNLLNMFLGGWAPFLLLTSILQASDGLVMGDRDVGAKTITWWAAYYINGEGYEWLLNWCRGGGMQTARGISNCAWIDGTNSCCPTCIEAVEQGKRGGIWGAAAPGCWENLVKCHAKIEVLTLSLFKRWLVEWTPWGQIFV